MGRRAPRDIKRTEVLSLRVDPKIRYLADLAARQQRRNLSSFTEWAIEEALKKIETVKGRGSLAEQGQYLWDVYEPDRFLKLAFTNPHLLTHEEQVIYKLLDECGYFRDPFYDDDQKENPRLRDDLEVDTWRLRRDWPTVLAVARGQQPPEVLMNIGRDEKGKKLIPGPRPNRKISAKEN